MSHKQESIHPLTMRITVLAFFIGILAVLYGPLVSVPAWPSAYGLLSVMGLLIALGWARSFWVSGLLGLLAGAMWVVFYVHSWGPPMLPQAMEWQTMTLRGTIESIPDCNKKRCRFNFQIEETLGLEQPWAARVRLSWYKPEQPLVAGQQWQLQAKLKRPHGFANPGGFDYEAWLYEAGIAATGYVREADQARLLDETLTLDGARQQLGQQFRAALPDAPLSGVLLALVNGDRQHINSTQWQVLTHTGTIHLMAISGLHIGLIYGLFFWLGRYAWSARASLCLLRPAQDIGAILGLVAALGYAALAGFAIPTQRALLMLAVVTLVLLLRRMTSAWDVLLLALLGVLLMDPLAVLAPGFWLSFMAVAVILGVVMNHAEDVQQAGVLSRSRRWFNRLLVIQLALAFGLLPLLAFLFNQVSLISPLANLLAVPWVSLLVVPLVLLGAGLLMIWPAMASEVLQLATWLMQGLWQLLEALAALPWAVHYLGQPTVWVAMLAVAGVLLALLLRSPPVLARWRGLALVLVLPLMGGSPSRLPVGSYQLDVLDVGQGLAVVVRTHDHTLLFDTGFSSGADFDSGRLVVLPYLHHQGIGQLDTVIVSHDDSDHAGGLSAIMQGTKVNQLLVGQSSRYRAEYALAESCQAGQKWQWDGVTFEILHPGDAIWKKQNNRSCVLRIDNGQYAALITADIEQKVEAALLEKIPGALAADILLVPHHGSKSSSSAAFIDAVSPDIAIHTVGYLNRFRHPHPDVQARYRQHGIRQYRSDQDGMVSILAGTAGTGLIVNRYRGSQPRPWRFAASAHR